MKSNELFFISSYTADDVMITMDEGDIFTEYSYLPEDLLRTDYLAEKVCSMMARSEIHTIWMAGFVKPEDMIKVRDTDKKLLSKKEMYLNKGRELSRDDIIEFFDWLEEAIEDEDKVEK